MEIAFLIFVSIFCGGGLGVASVSAWKYYRKTQRLAGPSPRHEICSNFFFSFNPSKLDNPAFSS
jgi:hypothetical protein